MKSSFFYERHNETVASLLKDRLNSTPDFLSERTAPSTRAAGDAIQDIIADELDKLLGDWCQEYSSAFARRAMADVAFRDKEGFYCLVDVKTHREDTRFNMPNLTSVERLSRLYEDDRNIFSLILVKYALDVNRVKVSDVLFLPIEFLDWECLTIGALGWGQIQIANSNRISINQGYSRRKWMLSLCEAMFQFYPGEIFKIEQRMERFHKVEAFWEQKQDIWAV